MKWLDLEEKNEEMTAEIKEFETKTNQMTKMN